MESLKKEILELLDKDREFRYTVAGYLGLSEILKKLDVIVEEQRSLREEQTKVWREIKSLREEQTKIWKELASIREEQKSFRKEQTKIWEEIKSLREEQVKLREEQNRLWKSVEKLGEGQNRLWKSVERLWVEVKDLREGQNRLWEEVKDLRRDFKEMHTEQVRMRRYMASGFRVLSRVLRSTFEDHTASFLEVMLAEMGYPDVRVEKRFLAYQGRMVEINLFCEDPLLVGEATLSVETVDEARREVEKLLEYAEIVEKVYGRKPKFIVLSIARAAVEAQEALKKLAEEHGIKLISREEIEGDL